MINDNDGSVAMSDWGWLANLQLCAHPGAVRACADPAQIVPRRAQCRIGATKESADEPNTATQIGRRWARRYLGEPAINSPRLEQAVDSVMRASPHRETARARRDVVYVPNDTKALTAVEGLVHVALHRVGHVCDSATRSPQTTCTESYRNAMNETMQKRLQPRRLAKRPTFFAAGSVQWTPPDPLGGVVSLAPSSCCA